MSEIRDFRHEIHALHLRLVIAGALIFVCFLLLLIRFIDLQVVRHEYFMTRAEENRISLIPLTPTRGQILDRNGIVLAHNYSAYTLEIMPHLVSNLKQTIDDLSKVIRINESDRRQFRKNYKELKSLGRVPIRYRLTEEEVARFAAHQYRFPGVELFVRLFREYPYQDSASHIIGYIGKINEKEKDEIENSPDSANYRGTDHIGKIGIEKQYEELLHGVTGIEAVEVNAGGQLIRTLSRTAPEAGANIRLTIDMEVQRRAEQIFIGRRGALVAIEPSTGEIIALVSKPGFDLNLFVDGIDSTNWNVLNSSPDKPLLNRAIRGRYPPGSTYKPFMSLAALELNKRRPEDVVIDPGFYWYGNHKFRDDKASGHGHVNMHRSIVESCDTYYYSLAVAMGVNTIHDYMKLWGFGELTGVDLPNELAGILPSTEWKQKRYKQKWYSGETVSLGIGQGYNSFTPIQVAASVAGLANNGVVMQPRLIHSIQNKKNGNFDLVQPVIARKVNAKPEHLDIVRQAMMGVNQYGTASRSFYSAPYTSGGKTGTAQVIGMKQGEKYNASRLHEMHRDHALYIAFAPAEQPKIAIYVLVENGGFGASSAAPIARQFMDYYLIERERQRGNLNPEYLKSNKKPAVVLDSAKENAKDMLTPSEAAEQAAAQAEKQAARQSAQSIQQTAIQPSSNQSGLPATTQLLQQTEQKTVVKAPQQIAAQHKTQTAQSVVKPALPSTGSTVQRPVANHPAHRATLQPRRNQTPVSPVNQLSPQP